MLCQHLRLLGPKLYLMTGEQIVAADKRCFVVMPITTPTSYVEKLGDPEHFAHVLAHLFTPALQAAGLTAVPPAATGSTMIHAEIIRNLEQANFVLCDLSTLNPNVFFELGIRTSLDRPVILVKDNLTDKIPFDLNAINTLTYDSSITPWSLEVEIPHLAAHVQSVTTGADSGNSMWSYFGLTKRGAPSEAGGNPVEAKLDLLLHEMEKSQLASVEILALCQTFLQTKCGRLPWRVKDWGSVGSWPGSSAVNP